MHQQYGKYFTIHDKYCNVTNVIHQRTVLGKYLNFLIASQITPSKYYKTTQNFIWKYFVHEAHWTLVSPCHGFSHDCGVVSAQSQR
jgi:hypothetical protein